MPENSQRPHAAPRRRWLWVGVLVPLLFLGAVAAARLWPRGTLSLGPEVPLAKPALTVARTGAADFRSLGEALAHAGPGDTIRVLDDATYPEGLSIDDPARWRGLTLEAPRNATLEPPGGPAAAVLIANMPGVTVRGFRINVPRIQQHALLVRGEAAGVTLEQITSTQPPGSVCANLYVTGEAHGTPAAPIRVRGCTLVAGALGAALEGSTGAAVSDIELDGNRFTCTGTHVLLGRAVRHVSLHNNVFVEGYLGVAVSLSEPGRTEGVRLGNNTWFRTRRWLGLQRADLGRDVEVYNNLLLGVETTDLPGGGEGLPSWTFRANYWEPGLRTDRAAAARLATLWADADLLSLHPPDPNFLVPRPGSPAADGGAGGDLPAYVGAFPSAGGKE